MAIDFGVFSALRGVTSGMANSRAEARKAEAAAVNQLYTDYQNKQQQNLQYEMQTADYFDKVNEIANEAVVRPQDRDFIQDLSDRMQEEIARNVKKYGGYTKFMQAGGWKQIRDYKKQLIESDDFARLKINAGNFAKIQELQGSDKANQIYQKDLDNITAYFQGDTDTLSYSGTKGLIDMDAVRQNIPKGVNVTTQDILSIDNNYSVLSTNMGVEYGINRSDYTSAEWNQYLDQYIQQQPEFAGMAMRGTGDPLPFDVGSDINQSLIGINATAQLGDDLRTVIAGDGGSVIRNSYGAILDESPLRNYENAARIMTAPNLENGWGEVLFGDRWSGMNTEISVNLGNSRFNFYDEDGFKIGSESAPLPSSGFRPGVGRAVGVGSAGALGGISGAAAGITGASTIGGVAAGATIGGPVGAVIAGGTAALLAKKDTFKYDEVEDLTPTGIYMVQKVTYKDTNGNQAFRLIPNQKTAEELRSEFGDNISVSNTYAMRLAYDRVGKFDDDIMLELPSDSYSLGELTKKVDMNDVLQTQRDASVLASEASQGERRRIEQINAVKQKVAGDYQDAMSGRNYDEFYNHAIPRLAPIIQTYNLPVNSLNPLMALNLELTRGKGPDAFDQSLLNFNSINQVPGGNDLITALKGHDMYSFFQILQNDFGIDKKSQNRIRNTIKDLSLTTQFV